MAAVSALCSPCQVMHGNHGPRHLGRVHLLVHRLGAEPWLFEEGSRAGIPLLDLELDHHWQEAAEA